MQWNDCPGFLILEESTELLVGLRRRLAGLSCSFPATRLVFDLVVWVNKGRMRMSRLLPDTKPGSCFLWRHLAQLHRRHHVYDTCDDEKCSQWATESQEQITVHRIFISTYPSVSLEQFGSRRRRCHNISTSALSAQGGGQQDVEREHGEPRGAQGNAGRRRRAFLLPRPVTQRRVAAGDAHRVQLAGAELLVARGGDETGSRRGARLSVVNPLKQAQKRDKLGSWWED